MLLRKASNSLLVEGGTWDDGGSAGMEKPGTEERGCKGLAASAAPAETIPCCVEFGV